MSTVPAPIRQVEPLTRTAVRSRFPGAAAGRVNHGLRAARWKPTARWLATEARLDVHEARDRERLAAGQVVVAPTGKHLVIADGFVRLSDEAAVDTFKPSVTPLFLSAARVYGPRVCGVILTGMGRDGAEGLRAIKHAGGPTLAQDEATSAVFGMPKAAIDLGAVDRVLGIDDIARALVELAR